jgi:nitrite reductase/ring-hydroxylating ferredoxin subunit
MSSAIASEDWQELTGLKPDAERFPVRARVGGEGIVVFRVGDGFRGVERACPHMRATMMEAELTSNDSMLRCPLHVFTFRLSDGKGVNCPGFRLRMFEIRQEGEHFLARAMP